jgi:hypothetical protein
MKVERSVCSLVASRPTSGFIPRFHTLIPLLSILLAPPCIGHAAQVRSVSSIWHDPGRVEKLNMSGGSGGTATRPRPPFRFVEQLASGTSLKVRVRDARGREWVAKWGTEVKGENFGSRLAWACGYWVRPTYFVAKGVIRSVPHSIGSEIGADGAFRDARFQLWDAHALRGHDWS